MLEEENMAKKDARNWLYHFNLKLNILWAVHKNALLNILSLQV